MKKLFTSLLIITALVTTLSLSFTPLALAQTSVEDDIFDNLEPTAITYGQTRDADAEQILAEGVADVIRIILSILGIILIVLIIYAGFMWMTAGGNEERVSKAKKIMGAAIIGITIILSAYLITAFVINQLIEATGAGR